MKAEPDNIFDINADTGEIRLKPYIKSMDIVQNITNQKDCTWSVVVQARDRGSPSFSTTTLVKIDITEAVIYSSLTIFSYQFNLKDNLQGNVIVQIIIKQIYTFNLFQVLLFTFVMLFYHPCR